MTHWEPKSLGFRMRDFFQKVKIEEKSRHGKSSLKLGSFRGGLQSVSPPRNSEASTTFMLFLSVCRNLSSWSQSHRKVSPANSDTQTFRSPFIYFMWIWEKWPRKGSTLLWPCPTEAACVRIHILSSQSPVLLRQETGAWHRFSTSQRFSSR